MDAAIIYRKADTIYDFRACYKWCIENMTMPSDRKHDGTWGCNGSYYWRAYSGGAFRNTENFPVIDNGAKDWGTIPGSNELYSFRAKHDTANEMQCFYVCCFCDGCRANVARKSDEYDHDACPYFHITGAPFYINVDRKPAAPGRRQQPRRRVRGRRNLNEDDDE